MADFLLSVRLTADGEDLGKELRVTEGALGKLGAEGAAAGRQMERGFGGATAAAQALTRAAGTLLGALGFRELGRYADSWSDIGARVGLAVGSMEAAGPVMDRLATVARRTYSSLDLTAEGFIANSVALGELGYATRQQLDYTEALNNALVVSGARADRARMVQDALARAMADGALASQELQTITRYGVRVSQALAEGLGTNVIGLRALAAEGKITGDTIYRALTSQLETLRAEADSMPATIGDAFTLMGNAALQTIGAFDQANEVSERFATSLIAIADNMPAVLTGTAALAGLFAARTVGPWIAGLGAATAALARQEVAAVAAGRAQAALAAANVETARTTAAATQATTANAAAELARIQVIRQTLAAEIALENQRLAAQISQTGRNQSLQRTIALRQQDIGMATLQARAEAALVAAQGRAIAGSAAVATAQTAQTAATAAATVAARAGTIALAGLRGALAFLGGPVGVGILALSTAAWFAFGRSTDQATEAAKTNTAALADLQKALAGTDATALAVAKSNAELRRSHLDNAIAVREEALANKELVAERQARLDVDLRAADPDRTAKRVAALDAERAALAKLREERAGLDAGIRDADGRPPLSPIPPPRTGGGGDADKEKAGAFGRLLETLRGWEKEHAAALERAREVLDGHRREVMRALGDEVGLARAAEAEKLAIVEDMAARRLITEEEAALARSRIALTAGLEIQDIERRNADAAEAAAERQLRASKRWQDGATRGLRDYAAAAADSASAAEEGVGKAFRSMEDLGAVFFSGNIQGWRDWASAAIAEIMRVWMRQMVLGPLAKSLGGLDLGSLFGSSGPAFTAPTSRIMPGVGMVDLFHSGGVVGRGAPARRAVPMDLFAGAPRFHSGGVVGPGEVPAILRRREEVLTPDDPRHIDNQGGGGRRPQIVFAPVTHIRIDGEGVTRAQIAAALDVRDRQLMGRIEADMHAGGRLAVAAGRRR